MQKPLFRSTLLALSIGAAGSLATSETQAAVVFLEQGGRVVIEAEHFDGRATDPADNHHWHVVPDDDGTDFLQDRGSPVFSGARSGKYVQSLPDSPGGGQNQNQAGDHAVEPYADYKVKISTPGDYRLWLRWGGYDGSSDSMYASIVEVASPGWYRYPLNSGGRFSVWQGDAGPDLNDAGGGEVPAVFTALAAGTYTIRLGQREDGSAVDALILQLASMSAPTGLGPAESATEGNIFPVVAPVITIDAADTTGAVGGSATFTVGVSNNVVPASIKWFKNDVEIAGATDLTYTTPTLTAADNGARFKVTLANSAGTVTSRTATLSVVENLFVSGSLNYDYFPGSTRAAVEAGTAPAPSFAGNTVGSDRSGIVSVFESGVNFADNYANRFSGFFIPPTTGNYVFFVSGDDDSDLFLSTDENPANKKLIAREVSWSNNRQWQTSGGGSSTPEDKRSDQFVNTQWPSGNTITLTAGSRYYLEGVHAEGGGGDNFGATYKLESEDDTIAASGTPSRLTGSVIGVLIPQVMSLSGINAGFKALTFSVTDVGTSLIDPTSVKVTFDGQSVTATAAPKTTNGVTAFTYTYPARLQPGSTHSYIIEVRDTTGKPVSAAASFTLPTPWLPAADLKGPSIVDKLWAVRHIFGTGAQIGDIPTVLRHISEVGTTAFAGQSVDTTSQVVNFGNGGFFGNGLPYPDEVINHASGLWTGEDFVQLSVGHIVVPEESDYTFGVHSDDGFALRIRGGEVITVSGNGQADLADPETVVHPANTGDSTTRAVYHLKKGVYRIEFFWWERGGGDHGELYMAKGAFTTDASTDQWLLVGDPALSQTFKKLGVDAQGWTVISSDPGGDPLNTWAEADADLAATGGSPQNYDVLDVGDPQSNGGTLPFPKNTPADDDDYALKATAMLVVPENGTWVLGFNSDDGGYIKVAGQTFIEIRQNNTGLSVIAGDQVTCDCLTGNSGTTATITLAAGNYPIEVGMFERGGGSFLQARGAEAAATSLPLLARNGGGTFTTPQAFQLTNLPAGVEDRPILTVARAGAAITISWPATATGFRLRSSANVAGPYADVVGVTGNSHTINNPAGTAFYILQQ